MARSKAPQVDDSPEAAAALAALGTPQASKDVVALIVGDVVDASRPRYDNGSSSSQRMLTFSVRCGTCTRRCYEAAPLKAEAYTGDAILLRRSATAVGDLLKLEPTTAEVFCGNRPPPPPPPKPKEDGPPPFEPFDVEAAAKASRERHPPPPPPPPKARTGLASLEPKERRSVALVVEGLEASEDGGVVIRAGGERLQASAPLRKFLLRDQDPKKVLPKIATHLTGKTLSLEVERCDKGFVVHNLS